MNRFTRRFPGGYGLVDGRQLGTVRNNRAVIDRLAAYENTGLDPAEINDLALKVAALETIEAMYDGLGNPDHIRQLVMAEKNGLIPPCKRGDVVHCIRHNPGTGYYVKALTVCSVTMWEPGQFSVFTTKDDMIGKTAFITHKEAESALTKEGSCFVIDALYKR